MEERGFDALTRRLANGVSRRSILRGFIGGGAALTAARMTGPVSAAPAPKVTICHFSEDTGTFAPITISGNAVDAHLTNHGDRYQEVLASFTMSATDPSPIDSGVYLNDGDSVLVTITGIAGWCCGLQLDANGSAPCGFEGIPFNCGSVVGVIGGGNIFADYSPFFPVGTGSTIAASGTSGNLVLQYVDGCSSCYGDNNGEFSVTITRC